MTVEKLIIVAGPSGIGKILLHQTITTGGLSRIAVRYRDREYRFLAHYWDEQCEAKRVTIKSFCTMPPIVFLNYAKPESLMKTLG